MREVAGERRAVVEQERNAVVRVSRRVHDLARDADLIEERATLGGGDRDIVVRRDVHVLILRLGPLFHERDRGDLHVEHQQRNTCQFQLLGESSVINMVARR